MASTRRSAARAPRRAAPPPERPSFSAVLAPDTGPLPSLRFVYFSPTSEHRMRFGVGADGRGAEHVIVSYDGAGVIPAVERLRNMRVAAVKYEGGA